MSIPFANVASTEGRRLLAFMRLHAPRAEGGLDGVALRHNLRRQTPYDWASGTRKPNLGTMGAWAKALGVTRAEMVAAMDATPPETLSELSEAQVLALVEEIGEEVVAALASRLPQRLGAKTRAGVRRHAQAGGGPSQPRSNERR